MNMGLNFISSCLQMGKSSYRALEKKDDDFFIAQAQKWIVSCPIPTDEEVKGLKTVEETYKMARRILQSLKRVYVCLSNREMVQNHLIEIVRKHSLLKKKICDETNKLNGDREVINQISIKLIFVDPVK